MSNVVKHNDRLVLVRVTDPDITELYIEQWGDKHVGGQAPNGYTIYVPEDDELREDLEYAANALMSRAKTHFEWGQTVAAEKIRDRAMRLCAAAGLDQEGEFPSEEWGRLNQSMWEDEI